MDSRFPLLRLPSRAVLNVLQSMDILEKITFSLISKTTKSYCLKIRLHACFDLNIKSTIGIEIYSGSSELAFELTPTAPHRRSDPPIRITTANVVTVRKTVYMENILSNQPTTHELQKNGFDVKDWIWHMKDITKQRRIDIFMYANGARFDVDSIAEILVGFDIHQLSTHDLRANRFHRSILEKIHTKSITMSHNPYRRNPEQLQKILCQNFVLLSVLDKPTTLSDILVMNTPVILIDYCMVDAMKTINRFIKLWQAGSSGRLRYIRSMFERDFIADANVILKGIKHSVIGVEVQRPFVELISGRSGVRLLNGGYDLFRRDGTKATVFVRVEGFEMFVWD
ncbi:unnamed protein product [Caenorhabditis brenneri]